ncbi:hypothetical protein C9F11_44505 (plasmid) [Streptomyces sp. YIM 121038]|uniref:DUF5988 family protein n=1 Tax=Streptomyces sp. YIM 121038 TaxID=2136401 RepID=UPI001110F2C2|nr:DUF5988 family protein [Streptomyces sp. YIM 121038]QCX82469.1 hypothetical protein C9F11_44505 [Streptomyces sp. YIM 121038]
MSTANTGMSQAGAMAPETVAGEPGWRSLPLLVVLRGGPSGLARVWQIPGRVRPEKVTIAYYGQHQHFVRTTETKTTEGQSLPVFRWSYSTKIAE